MTQRASRATDRNAISAFMRAVVPWPGGGKPSLWLRQPALRHAPRPQVQRQEGCAGMRRSPTSVRSITASPSRSATQISSRTFGSACRSRRRMAAPTRPEEPSGQAVEGQRGGAPLDLDRLRCETCRHYRQALHRREGGAEGADDLLGEAPASSSRPPSSTPGAASASLVQRGRPDPAGVAPNCERPEGAC